MTEAASASLAARAVRQAYAAAPEVLTGAVAAKAKTCLMDLIRCAFEARSLPVSRQAWSAVDPNPQGAPVIATNLRAGRGDAAFVFSATAHALLRDDMHAASISHHGLVVLPALLALSVNARMSGRAFLTATVLGYELGARLGATLLDAELASRVRPTALCSPSGAALAGAYALGLGPEQAAIALCLAADTSAGLNQWPHAGGSEVYFQTGAAARNAVTATLLAQGGAFASPTMLDGVAGLFAAYGRPAPLDLDLFGAGGPQILQVFNKALPICNFAQSATQAALELSRRPGHDPAAIRRLEIHVPEAAIHYPGCASAGPFERSLQAKMSIRFCVAAALQHGEVLEEQFQTLDDPRLLRLVQLSELRADPALTAGFPGRQGAHIIAELWHGARLEAHVDDVRPAGVEEIRDGLRRTASLALGEGRAQEILGFVDSLEHAEDAGRLAELCSLTALPGTGTT